MDKGQAEGTPMSTLLIYVLPQGMVFAADRNITVTVPTQADGTGPPVMYQAQDTACKIVRWPRRQALVGYVGLAEIGQQSTHEWLYDFVGDHVNFIDSKQVALDLREKLQETVGDLDPPQHLIVEFGTFAIQDGVIVPEMWHVTNVHGMNEKTGEYYAPEKDFRASEQILGNHLKHIRADKLREELRDCADRHDPFWFHQSIDLAIFNTLESAVKAGFKILQDHGRIHPPATLEDWERHARMWILVYGAYFEAFGGPAEKYVGGGADVLSIPWPGS